MELDLTAARAKRASESKSLVLRGPDGEVADKYELAAEFPAEALDHGAAGRVGQALRSLFIDGQEAEDFMKKYKPSMDDLLTIMRDAYGMVGEPGESLASGS